MRELHLQSLVIKAVKDHGGVAFKMANRFLIGVPDLFIQLPGCSSTLWEVKLTKTKFGVRNSVLVNLTKAQENFLRDVIRAGGSGGVMSFIQDRHTLYFSAQSGPVRHFGTNLYTLLEKGKREEIIVDTLLRRWRGV